MILVRGSCLPNGRVSASWWTAEAPRGQRRARSIAQWVRSSPTPRQKASAVRGFPDDSARKTLPRLHNAACPLSALSALRRSTTPELHNFCQVWRRVLLSKCPWDRDWLCARSCIGEAVAEPAAFLFPSTCVSTNRWTRPLFLVPWPLNLLGRLSQ